VLIGWQVSIARTDLPATYTLKASSGVHDEDKFVYFLYYKNLFPVASTDAGLNLSFYFDNHHVRSEPDRLDYSRDGAQRLLDTRGNTLVMEWGHTIRFGGWLATYLYLPDVWRLGSPQHAEMRVTNGLAFICALAALFVSCWVSRVRIFGAVLVALIGSNPFQLFEVYRRENIFGWAITMFCLVSALLIPIMSGRARWSYGWAAVVACGLALGTVFEIRSEYAAMLLAAIVAFASAPNVRWPERVALVAALVVTFVATTSAWGHYFDHKWEEARAVVVRAGGHPYPGPRSGSHQLWGSVWAGLGDFDDKYGHHWNDNDGTAFVQRQVKAKYGEDLPWWFGATGKPERTAEDYYDQARLYYRHPIHSVHAMDVVRDDFVNRVSHDPVWYLSILGRRVGRVLTQTSPVQISMAPGRALQLPLNGYIALLVLLGALALRDRFALTVLTCSLPLSATALAIYSGGNTPYYGVYHLCAIALAAGWLSKFAWRERRVEAR
jgi:hypothetical protein